MKVLAICGSPQKSNTFRMLSWILESCKDQNAQTAIINLKKLDLEYCLGCGVCYNSGKPCVIDDSIHPVLDKMRQADAIIIGSPNFYTNVTGLLKNFMDRTNGLYKPPALKDKITASIIVGARAIEEHDKVENDVRLYFRMQKTNYIGSVIARAEFPGDIEKQPDVKEQCTQLGKKIIQALHAKV
ncbi:flavodoxin family protein [Nanoarchaeota archaeon]